MFCVLTVESCRGVTCGCFRRKRWKRKSIGDCGAHCLVQYWWPGKLHGHCALGCPYRVVVVVAGFDSKVTPASRS